MAALDGKIAIVAGASGGIGHGIALKLADEGATVIVNGRTRATGEAAVRTIRERGGRAEFIRGDILSGADMRALAQETIARFGAIDILVASAGGVAAATESDAARQGADSRLFRNLDPAVVAGKVSAATLGKLNPAHAVVNHMIGRGGGSILFITAEGGRVPTVGQTVASLASGGLIVMAKVLAKELAASKIRVNTVAVTLVADTPAWDLFMSGNSNRDGMYSKIRDRAPLGLARPADIAELAAFLVSDRAAYITGATVSPTGGLTYS
ncbi:MAG: SDR family oxidoreductase [Betaproteobacteria bacterium]|nr:SDR family oxidoreductase [Betaproteobacteria bacterium]